MEQNQYILRVDEELNITHVAYTFDIAKEDIILSNEEYEKALIYSKFNPETREFYGLIKVNEEITDKQRIEQLEETVGILAEQLAKQTLGM